MAAPVDADRVTTDGSTETTSQTLNLPGALAAGNVVVAAVRAAGATTISWPGGWTELAEVSGDASDDSQSVAWRLCDGTEGATITVTFGTAKRMAGLAYKITGGDTVELSAVVNGSSANPNSALFTFPWSPATREALVLSLGGNEDARTISSGPTGYSNATIISCTGSSGAGLCSVYGASKQVTAASEDPGAWTLSSTTQWMVWTVLVYAATPQARVSQLPVEAVIEPTDQKVRVSQVPVEVIIEPTDMKARLSQLPVEVVIDVVGQKARLSQLPVEVVIENARRESFQAVIIIPSIGPP